MVPFYCGGFSQWVGLDVWLVEVCSLGKLALVFWWVESWISSLWSASSECPVVSFEMGLWVWCDFEQPVYLQSVLCSCIAGEFAWYILFWNLLLLGGGWFQCRYGGFWLISYYFMFPVVRSSPVFSGFGLKPLASGFQSYSSSSLKTSPYIQH